ncbi:hypothetical protein NL676_017828 [Syzygium grande]|nr:hypothetical protein NL676_017828 [Syzygium grande]
MSGTSHLTQGASATAPTSHLISWVIAKRGPTYPSMFSPLTLIFVTVLEALILGEAIHLGTYDESHDPQCFLRLHDFHEPLSGNILLLKWTKEGVEDELHALVNNVAAMAVEAAADESTDDPATKSDVPKRFTSYRYHRTATKFSC